MMKRIIPYIFIGFASLLAGCSNNDAREESPDSSGGFDPIVFTASTEMDTNGSRVLSDFPNDRRIGVIASANESGSVDWPTGLWIDNVGATATAENGGVFTFGWDTPQYWPMDNSDLSFLAYSPFSDNSAVTLNSDRSSLNIVLQPNMPDVMYASINEHSEITPFNKSDGTVDLGTFKHALSRLIVSVKADPSMNPDIRVTSIRITTTKRRARLDLLGGDGGLLLLPDETFTYSVFTGSSGFYTTPLIGEVFLYPGTETDTQVSIVLADGIFTFDKTYHLTEFLTTAGSPVGLKRAYNTMIDFVVSGTTVQNPNDQIDLQGTLTEWNFQGDLGVTIN